MGDSGKTTGSGAHSWTEPEGEPVPPIADSPPLNSGVVLAGRYQIHKVIGRGGMGVVVSAYDRTLGTTVAIKILRPEYAGERQWTERFAREVRLARQIHHPNVCRVFDFEQADGRVFLVMELARGGTLRSEIASGRGGARAPAERIADARALTEGLAAIHSAGIIHRDVTPSNVLRMADGRVVLSDFGLATDSFESTTNLRGGTIAYMAPEVVRGGALSFASDVWSLGAVIHEAVFGERPRWRDPAGFEMLPPELGRPLTPEERVVFETSRACTAVEPERRPASAAVVATRLAGGQEPWRRRPWSRRAWRAFAVVASASLVAVILATGMRRLPEHPGVRPSDRESPLLIPTGQPADWTESSRVLAEVPARITCLVVLPDGHTVRFAWGTPLRAEDLDTATGRRVPSPLVPQAYAEGCPSLSPQGRLLFPGHTSDGRAFAFVSPSPDGSRAEPVVPTAEPTMSSEPVWLPDGETFLIDVDMKHAGAYSLKTKRLDVLTGPRESSNGCLKFVVGSRVFTVQPTEDNEMEFLGSDASTFEERVRFRLPGLALDLRSLTEEKHLAALAPIGRDFSVVEFSPNDRKARWLGTVTRQYVRYPAVVAPGLVFVSMARSSEVEIRQADGFHRTAIGADLRSVSRCGTDFVATMVESDKSTIVRFNAAGEWHRATDGPMQYGPVCSPDGSVLYYLTESGGRIERCDVSGCRSFAEEIFRASALSISPMGDRIALVNLERRGFRAQWLSTVDGRAHDVSDSETGCTPVWSSEQSLWVSRRRAGKILWVEVDADTGRETGRVVPGVRDCTDGREDPGSPGDPDLRLRSRFVSQVRLLPSSALLR